MDLALDRSCLERYKSPVQQARCLSENWAERNLYCPSCLRPKVSREKASTKVYDFTCPRCFQTYNLKASKKPFAGKVRDAEYHTFMTAIRSQTNPNLVLMRYDKPNLCVTDVEVIPRFFFSTSCVIPSAKTKPRLRNRPWQGCDISLERVPSDGRVNLVQGGQILDPKRVNEKYTRTLQMMGKRTMEGRGWTSDVLRCVRDLHKSEFTLPELYTYQNELS